MIDDEIRSWTIIEMNAYDSKKNTYIKQLDLCETQWFLMTFWA